MFAKAMMSKTDGTLTQTKAGAPNCTGYHCIPPHHMWAVKMPASSWNVRDEAVKMTNFINSCKNTERKCLHKPLHTL